MKLISAQNISYRINEKMLFHNLSLEVCSGEGLHIKGRNGSGKSTLLKILLGITSVSKGLIEYKNFHQKLSEGTGLILTSHIQPSVECQVIELDKTNV